MASNYTTATKWEKVSDSVRDGVKKWIAGLVGYPCKLACDPNMMGTVDITVFNVKKNAITDWLEIQPSGAIGVIFEEYEDPDAAGVLALSDRCDDYNDSIGVSFEESDSDSSESESSESESEDAPKSDVPHTE